MLTFGVKSLLSGLHYLHVRIPQLSELLIQQILVLLLGFEGVQGLGHANRFSGDFLVSPSDFLFFILDSTGLKLLVISLGCV